MDSFQCTVCGERYEYSYHGQRPPFCPQVAFLEAVFVRRDPFASYALPLCVGGSCSVCGATVCAAAACSVFYTRRLCAECVQARRDELPEQVLRLVDRHARRRRNEQNG